jgi:hypothetical protein
MAAVPVREGAAAERTQPLDDAVLALVAVLRHKPARRTTETTMQRAAAALRSLLTAV